MTATVSLDDGREVEIPVEYLSSELVPGTMDERQLTAPPPIEPPEEPEMEIEGPDRSTHDDAAAMRASEQDEATDGPIDVDEKMDIFES